MDCRVGSCGHEPLVVGLAFFILSTGPAGADAGDDYVACLIGRSAVALHHQTGKMDAAKAQQVAYRQCKSKQRLGSEEGEGASDFVNMMVERMANELGR
ncbi:hypothetical protein [Methylocystis parvus]|uniref:hypothetical protein n=1 Tax=Methylocystis parvus TaxID=134 RepID=UPI003C79462B